MPRHSGRSVPSRRALLAAAVALLLPPPLGAQSRIVEGGSRACVLCHGELELLRQQTPSLARAREIFVPLEMVEGTAHGRMSCRSCHEGFESFPHALPDPEASRSGSVSTRTCASCHEGQDGEWRGSIHEREDEGATCTSCHGVHDVRPPGELSSGDGLLRMNGVCVDCHDTSGLPPEDPHRDAVPCWSCHTPHETESTDAPGSRVAPPSQAETCGACHGVLADSATTDAHGSRLAQSGIRTLAMLEHEGHEAPPACTSCHGSHGMVGPADPEGPYLLLERCSECHEHYAYTFDGTYHGQATALGSAAVATCQDCHSAHDVHPASDARSTVSEARLVETCQTCHPNATPSFAAFQPHADPHDREKYPLVYWVYTLMTALLIGVFTFFGTHTALWLVRLAKDALDRPTGGA